MEKKAGKQEEDLSGKRQGGILRAVRGLRETELPQWTWKIREPFSQ